MAIERFILDRMDLQVQARGQLIYSTSCELAGFSFCFVHIYKVKK